MKNKKIDEKFGFGLLPTPADKRDFSLGGVFGQADISIVPNEDFTVSTPLKIKDQGRSDMCTAYSLSAISEDQELIQLDENFTFAKIKEERGEYKQWGGDLRSGCKVATKVGFIAKDESPLYQETVGRDFVANWKNWEKFPELIDKAQRHKKFSYFKVDGRYDIFDNMRLALWEGRNEKQSIYTGANWQSGWTYAKGGVIPKTITDKGAGHAFKVFGQKMINREPYLMVQNSFGTEVGDGGIYYFPRVIVNHYFTFGSYQFKDMPPEQAKELNDKIVPIELNGQNTVSISVWERLLNWLLAEMK
jgi:hypothetical protein